MEIIKKVYDKGIIYEDVNLYDQKNNIIEPKEIHFKNKDYIIELIYKNSWEFKIKLNNRVLEEWYLECELDEAIDKLIKKTDNGYRVRMKNKTINFNGKIDLNHIGIGDTKVISIIIDNIFDKQIELLNFIEANDNEKFEITIKLKE